MLTFFSVLIISPNVRAETAIIYVDPSLKVVSAVGETFRVNITVASVTNLFAWEFSIYYRSEVLNASSWTPGPVFTGSGLLIDATDWTDNYNETHGLVHIICTFLGPGLVFNGTTVFAALEFKVKSFGVTPLHLDETRLLDNSDPLQDIPHTTADGTVRAGLRDVAVTQITLGKTIVSNSTVPINVTVANQGQQPETFNVTLYYNSVEIGTQTVTGLATGASLPVKFVWNTTSVPKGNYTIKAAAQTLPGEIDTTNNNLTDGWIFQAMLGDLNGDGQVNIVDITIIARAFNTKPGDERWNPNADLNNDGTINIIDITKVAKEFGKKDP
jgi:hypothetical protein